MTAKQTPPDFTETKTGGETFYRGNIIRVDRDRVRLPDGAAATRDVVRHPGAAAIIPLTDDGAVIMEWQYRYPLARHLWEIPAGKCDAGESPLVTAKRELLEETGYRAEHWREIFTAGTCVSFCDERLTFFCARGLSYVGHKRDAGEFLHARAVPPAAAWDMATSGDIADIKTLTALLWLRGGGAD